MTPTRRDILRSGLGAITLAGAATVGLAGPAAARAIRPQRLNAPAAAGGLNWTGWSPTAPGMITNSALACAPSTLGGTSMWLFATGAADSKIYANTTSDNQNWNGWFEVPGNGLTDLAPSAATGPEDQLVLTVTGQDGAIYVNITSDGSTWTGWNSIGGVTDLPPLFGPFASQFYAVGTDSQIYSNSTTDLSSFSGWTPVPGNGLTNAGLSYADIGGINVLFATGTDNAIYYNEISAGPGEATTQGGTWLQVAGGGLTDAAPAGVQAPGLDFINWCLFVKGYQSQQIYINRASGSPLNFGGWEEVPGGGRTNVALCPTIADSPNGHSLGQLLLFAVGPDNVPYVNVGS